jgi:predicted nucleotidyltransferase
MSIEEEQRKELQEAVLFTVIYYNVLSFPPTTFEVWKHLINFRRSVKTPCDFFDVARILDVELRKGDFVCRDSFWCLKGFEDIVRQRIRKQKIAVKKIKKAKNWIKLAAPLLFVRGIFINGTLAMKRANEQSDWDVLVVMKKNRIWSGRLIISVFLQLFFKRRHHDKIKDRFCLNHFLTEDGLIMEEEDNAYLANELVFTLPIYGEKIFNKFIQLNEHQLFKYKPNYSRDRSDYFFLLKENPILEKIKLSAEWLADVSFGDFFNRLVKKAMVKRIMANPKTYIPGADIRFSDQALIFLPQPRREIIWDRAGELFKKISGDEQLKQDLDIELIDT